MGGVSVSNGRNNILSFWEILLRWEKDEKEEEEEGWGLSHWQREIKWAELREG